MILSIHSLLLLELVSSSSSLCTSSSILLLRTIKMINSFMRLAFFNHLYIAQSASLSAAVFILFRFLETLFSSTASNILLLFLNQFETVFLTRPYFCDVALDVTFFQSLAFVRKIRYRKLSFACMLHCHFETNQIKVIFEGVYVTVANPTFCLFLYLTGVHFRGELQHVGDVSEQKMKY